MKGSFQGPFLGLGGVPIKGSIEGKGSFRGPRRVTFVLRAL